MPSAADSTQLKPFHEEGWAGYEVKDASGKVSKVGNGFYYRKAVFYDEATATSRMVLRLPQSELNRGDRLGLFAVRAYCEGKETFIQVQIPLKRRRRRPGHQEQGDRVSLSGLQIL